VLIDEYELRIELSRLDNQMSHLDSSLLSKNVNGGNDDQKLALIKNIQTSENLTAAVNPAKDAKDCRAPVMLINPQ